MQIKSAERQELFRSVFDSYSKLVYSVAYSYMKNRSDANDIMQDVFLKFYQHMEKLEEPRFKPWLITVTANSCKNMLRSGWFSRTFFTEDTDDIPYEQDFGEESDLFRAVMRLPEKERIPIHLFYYEGCTTHEISQMLKVKESTVRVRLMRAREKLKKLLEEESV